MKLIVGGSTGYVATDIIRRALSHPAVTSIVAIGRREADAPSKLLPGADASKLKSVVCDDFMNYSDSLKQELAGADACIWTIAVTPSKLKTMPFDEVSKICHGYAVTAIETIGKLTRPGANHPLRFIYISGVNGQRDPAKKPWIMGDYSLLRGQTETYVLDYAKKSNGVVEAQIAKPGIIGSEEKPLSTLQSVIAYALSLGTLDKADIATALLDQAVNGFEQETLLGADLIRIAQKAGPGDQSTTN